jgi:two-component system NtrC family sensor kinase
MLENHQRPDRVKVALNLADSLPLVLGDSDQLQQVVLNLSVNALHAVGNTGCITLCTRVRAVSDTYPEGAVELEVADTGPGIPAADHTRVFEPFFTTKGMEEGTGLGLAICREIVLNHRGEIRVESQEGHGTRFIVTFPVARTSSDLYAQAVSQQKENPYGNGAAYSASTHPRT